MPSQRHFQAQKSIATDRCNFLFQAALLLNRLEDRLPTSLASSYSLTTTPCQLDQILSAEVAQDGDSSTTTISTPFATAVGQHVPSGSSSGERDLLHGDDAQNMVYHNLDRPVDEGCSGARVTESVGWHGAPPSGHGGVLGAHWCYTGLADYPAGGTPNDGVVHRDPSEPTGDSLVSLDRGDPAVHLGAVDGGHSAAPSDHAGVGGMLVDSDSALAGQHGHRGLVHPADCLGHHGYIRDGRHRAANGRDNAQFGGNGAGDLHRLAGDSQGSGGLRGSKLLGETSGGGSETKNGFLEVAQHLMTVMGDVRTKGMVHLHPHMKRLICKRCANLLMPLGKYDGKYGSKMTHKSRPKKRFQLTCKRCQNNKAYECHNVDYKMWFEKFLFSNSFECSNATSLK